MRATIAQQSCIQQCCQMTLNPFSWGLTQLLKPHTYECHLSQVGRDQCFIVHFTLQFQINCATQQGAFS